jgi:hypothetical protein
VGVKNLLSTVVVGAYVDELYEDWIDTQKGEDIDQQLKSSENIMLSENPACKGLDQNPCAVQRYWAFTPVISGCLP